MTLIAVEPDAKLEFAINGSGGSGSGARLRLKNVSGGLVAFKVKSTAPKSYVIKPASGSIRKAEVAEVQMLRKAQGDDAAILAAAAEGGPDAAPLRDRRPDRFLVQAAVVDTEEKKLWLHAAHRGKAAGASKFWENTLKEAVEEHQLEAAIVQGDGCDDDVQQAPRQEPAPRRAEEGVPSSEDIDAIIGKMSKPGRSQPAADGGGFAGQRKEEGGSKPQAGVAPRLNSGGPSSRNRRAEDRSAEPDDTTSSSRVPLSLTSKKAAPGGPARKEDIVLQRHSRPVTFVTLDPNGKVLFTCGKDKMVYAWSCPEGEFLRLYEGHRGAVWMCSVSPDSKLLLTCGADSMVILWDVEHAQNLTEKQLPGVARCVEWVPNAGAHAAGRRRFLACSNSFKDRPAALAVMELTPGPKMAGKKREGKGAGADGPAVRLLTSIEEPTLPSAATQAAWVGTEGAGICSVHVGGDVMFWDAASGVCLGRLAAHSGPCSLVGFIADRTVMASCGRSDMEVKLWDLGAGSVPGESALLGSYQGDRPFNAVALHPLLTREDILGGLPSNYGAVCLTGGGQDAREVALVGAGTDDQFDPVPLMLGPGGLEPFNKPGDCEGGRRGGGGGHFGPIHCLAFSSDGSHCISGSEDGNIRIRELESQDTPAAQGEPQPPKSPHQQLQPPKSPKQQLQPPKSPHQQPRQQQQHQQQAPPGVVDQSHGGPRNAPPPPTTAPPPAPPPEAANRMVALYDFDAAGLGWPPGGQHQPLPFRKGQELQFLQDVGNGWALGCLPGRPDVQGFFPTEYVMPLSRYAELIQRLGAQQQQREQQQREQQQREREQREREQREQQQRELQQQQQRERDQTAAYAALAAAAAAVAATSVPSGAPPNAALAQMTNQLSLGAEPGAAGCGALGGFGGLGSMGGPGGLGALGGLGGLGGMGNLDGLGGLDRYGGMGGLGAGGCLGHSAAMGGQHGAASQALSSTRLVSSPAAIGKDRVVPQAPADDDEEDGDCSQS